MTYGGGINFWRKGDPALFGYVPGWMITMDDLVSTHQVVRDTFTRVMALHDDRLLVMVGALFIEEQLKSLFEEIISRELDLSWAGRINVLRGLKLVPIRLLDAVDFIRALRNKFAHELTINHFTDLPVAFIERLRTGFIDDIYQGPTPPITTDVEKFRNQLPSRDLFLKPSRPNH